MKTILLLVVLASAVAAGCTVPPAKDYSAFATCLTEAGVSEYGAYWCPNCAKVKLTMGEAWYNLDYVECDPKCVKDASGQLPAFCNGFESQTAQCLQLGIQKYPSWVRGNETLYAGTELATVAALTGCTLPA